MQWRKRAGLVGAALVTAALLALAGRLLMDQPLRTPTAPPVPPRGPGHTQPSPSSRGGVT